MERRHRTIRERPLHDGQFPREQHEDVTERAALFNQDFVFREDLTPARAGQPLDVAVSQIAEDIKDFSHLATVVRKPIGTPHLLAVNRAAPYSNPTPSQM